MTVVIVGYSTSRSSRIEVVVQCEYPIFPAPVFEGFPDLLDKNVTSKTPVFPTS